MLQPRQPQNAAESSPIAPALDPIAPLRAALNGHYEFEREIGQGAYATVYLARDLKHERKVAIKVLNADPTSETSELRFVREIRMLARLQHPNILPLHDSGHVEAILYYVMPFVAGETLRNRMDRERQLPLEDAICIAQEAADALASAHAQGIIHRDIKPENILLSASHAIVADFGIARAIDMAGIKQLTRTGRGSPGTPAYMAPEQLLGEGDTDARSDIYSLGCVLYEMLTGKAPFAGKEGFAKRFMDAAPVPSLLRDTVPAWADDIVATSLSRNPNDRFVSAGLFARALALGLARQRMTPRKSRSGAPPHEDTRIGEVPEISPGNVQAALPPATVSPRLDESPLRGFSKWIRAHQREAAGGTVALVALATAVTFSGSSNLRGSFGRSVVDSTRFVILPFVANDKQSEAIAARETNKLYEAFRAWDGLNLVPDLEVDEAVAQGKSPRNLSDALSFARKFGAGQLIWGHVTTVGGSLRTRAELYDLQRPNTGVRELILSGVGTDNYSTAVTALLARRDRPVAALGGDVGTHNFTAWQAYNRGHVALSQWDLADATADFARAVGVDPEFPAARLWLGQVQEWRNPLAPELWRQNVERAAASPSLSSREKLLAAALSGMANQQFPLACNTYRDLTKLDSLDFVGWYGLGECQALDRAVLPDRTSPSGWRWRSSYENAVRSFIKALRLNPGAHALLSFQRLRRLLPTTAVNPRLDDVAVPTFASFPSLGSDTIAFVPYPIAVFTGGLPADATITLNQALNRNLEVLMGIVRDWVRESPENPDAYEALGDVLETRGDIADGPDPAVSAPAAISRALRLSRDPQQRRRLVVREAGMRFKRGEYSGARAVADSLLNKSDPAVRDDPAALIGLSALMGRVGWTAEQAVGAGVIPEQVNGLALPTSLREVAGTFFAYAALGACGSQIASVRQQLEVQIQSSIADEQRDRVRTALISRPLSMMVPCTRGISALSIPPPVGGLANLQKAFAHNDTTEVKRRFRAIAQTHRWYRPADISLDRAYQEAWLRAATGDTADAIAQLDQSLNAIPGISTSALLEPGAAAAAGRAMALRAELAQNSGDSRTARRWAAAVSELWAGADPALQPTVARMKVLAAQPR